MHSAVRNSGRTSSSNWRRRPGQRIQLCARRPGAQSVPLGRRPGRSPFVWSVLGGIATATRRLRIGTGVTHHAHPPCGAGAGGGDRPADVRRALLPRCGQRRGCPSILLPRAKGRQSWPAAWVTGSSARSRKRKQCNTSRRPTVRASRATARSRPAGRSARTKRSTRPGNLAERGDCRRAMQDLPFEQASEMVSRDALAEAVVCGRTPSATEAIRQFIEAGCSHVSSTRSVPASTTSSLLSARGAARVRDSGRAAMTLAVEAYRRYALPALETAGARR